jgi:hypothetical protein
MPAGHGFKERRSEPRRPCDAIPASIRTDSGSLPAMVMDISRSGIRLEVETPLPVCSEITVYFNSIVAVAEVRYCRSNRNGSFDAGLRIQDVINST